MAELLDLFDDVEKDRYIRFCQEHSQCGIRSTIGGGISVIITGTGLGYCFECRCNRCGKIKNITNTDKW